MRKIRYGLGGILLFLAVMICNGVKPFFIYALAALLHEAGHILAAKTQKIKLKEIKFGIFGAKIETDERLISYKSEFFLALAGPLANLVAAAIIFAVSRASEVSAVELFEKASELLESGQSDAWGYLGFFAVSSLIHAVTNLVPIEKLDGGRVLYCAVAAISNERFAERVLSVTTAISLFAIWTMALYLMLKISSGIGIYAFAFCIFLTTLKKDNSEEKLG
ncbi:MAG: site-2 protease family protein [Clostridia bacterium]|nr:site-2 protease family protein [Clostridia bacterium]